jgi:RHS repeat-associated protein
MKIIESKSRINLAFPDGDERLLAGTVQTLIWSGGEAAEFVRIEYSTDNGSTYRTIVNRVPNNGSYDWVVPKDLSSSCLIRITEAEGRSFLAPKTISFEFSFKVSNPQELYVPVPGFSVDLGVPDYRMMSYNSLALEFVPYEPSRNVRIAANNVWTAPKSFDVFLDRWHRISVQFDVDNRIATIWMDNEILHDSVSLDIAPIHASYGAISISSDADARSRIRIDDVEVNISEPEFEIQNEDSEHVVQWKQIFLDDFENYRSSKEPLRHGGWVNPPKSYSLGKNEPNREEEVSPLYQLLEAYWISKTERGDKADFEIDLEDSISGLRSLKFDESGDVSVKIIKIFSLPKATPFDKSERSFMVVDRIADTIEGPIRRLTKRAETGSPATRSIRNNRSNIGKESTGKLRADIPVQRKQKVSAETRLLSAYPVGTYYVYAYDGRLLAEYNDVGLCTRDYIYVGNKLIAEYRPLVNEYYYYTSDQINSTRIVTDDFGTVVYASAHDPYGGEQLTWINAYNPSLKFSGKERDAESGLDYFGARYYDRSQYRLLSPNCVAAGLGSMHASHSWNAYSYPGNHLWAEMLVVAGWTVSATNIAAIIQPKPPEPEPEPPWWSVSYPWVSRPEDSLWVLIKSSGEKRLAEERNWRGFRENWDKGVEAAKLWIYTFDPNFFVDLITISEGLEIDMWGYISGYEYGSDPVFDAILADYGMSSDPSNPLSYWNPCYVMYHLYYDF